MWHQPADPLPPHLQATQPADRLLASQPAGLPPDPLVNVNRARSTKSASLTRRQYSTIVLTCGCRMATSHSTSESNISMESHACSSSCRARPFITSSIRGIRQEKACCKNANKNTSSLCCIRNFGLFEYVYQFNAWHCIELLFELKLLPISLQIN